MLIQLCGAAESPIRAERSLARSQFGEEEMNLAAAGLGTLKPERAISGVEGADPCPTPIKLGTLLRAQIDRCRFRDAAHASLNHDSIISDSGY